MDLAEVRASIGQKGITLLGAREHAKATEKYIDVVFAYPGQEDWVGAVPYWYRRTALFLETSAEIAAHIEKAYAALERDTRRKWVARERRRWNNEYRNKAVTKPFFDQLLNLRWNFTDSDLPENSNPQRRIQDIKDMGYTIATRQGHNPNSRQTDPPRRVSTQVILLPLAKEAATGYESFSPRLRRRIIQVLGNYDAYEGKVRTSGLLPDHKFPEISWDESVPQDNPDDMSAAEIRAKFQLLDNQRNLEKREACRQVFQTGKLGAIFGIDYPINGIADWPENIPRTGKASEEGWKLCPWYDIEAWRQSLNAFLRDHQQGTPE